MSNLTYNSLVRAKGKPLVWLHGEIKTPPMGPSARMAAGFLLRLLQQGEVLTLPKSRPMPAIGPRCHELRVDEKGMTWRIFYRTDPDAVVILAVHPKKTRTTPAEWIEACRRRLAAYDDAAS